MKKWVGLVLRLLLMVILLSWCLGAKCTITGTYENDEEQQSYVDGTDYFA